MPPDRPRAFKVPQPSTSSAAGSSSSKVAKAATKSIPAAPPNTKPSASQEDPDPDPFTTPPTQPPSTAVARATIPPELLTRLIHEFFDDKGMRVSKGADKAVGVYMETFVREAVARAVYERREAEDGGMGDFLEVEDLEKLAPQLLLDF